MTHNIILKAVAIASLLLASSAALADDPTGVLLQERGEAPTYAPHGQAPAFSDVGPCQPGTQSESFPNGQGFRCIPIQPNG
jgi:hypothetical protein